MAPDSSTLNSTHIFACIPAISVAACRLLFRQKRDSNRKFDIYNILQGVKKFVLNEMKGDNHYGTSKEKRNCQ